MINFYIFSTKYKRFPYDKYLSILNLYIFTGHLKKYKKYCYILGKSNKF